MEKGMVKLNIYSRNSVKQNNMNGIVNFNIKYFITFIYIIITTSIVIISTNYLTK